MSLKQRYVPQTRNSIELSSIVRHRVPLFGDAPRYGADPRLHYVYFVEGVCNEAPFGAVVLAPGHLSPRVDIYGPVRFERHEGNSVGIRAMIARPEQVETIDHPEIATPEQAAAFAEEMRARGREIYSGEKVLLDVPFRDKDKAKSLGARWSAEDRKWFVMARLVDLEDFAEWIPAPSPEHAPGM